MVFDLRRALLAKEERESARLMDFDFRMRARTLRLVAEQVGGDPDATARLVAEGDDTAVIQLLQAATPDRDIAAAFAAARAEARRQLMDEVGDPTPTRLG